MTVKVSKDGKSSKVYHRHRCWHRRRSGNFDFAGKSKEKRNRNSGNHFGGGQHGCRKSVGKCSQDFESGSGMFWKSKNTVLSEGFAVIFQCFRLFDQYKRLRNVTSEPCMDTVFRVPCHRLSRLLV